MEPMWKTNINTTYTFVGNLGRDHYKQYRNRTLPTIDKTLFGLGNTERNSNQEESGTSSNVPDNQRMFDESDVYNLLGLGSVTTPIGPLPYYPPVVEDDGSRVKRLLNCDTKLLTNIDHVTCIEQLLFYYKSPASLRKREENNARRIWASYIESTNQDLNPESTFYTIDSDDIDVPTITTLFEIDFSAFNRNFERNVIDNIYPKQENPKFHVRSFKDTVALLEHVLNMHNMNENMLVINTKLAACLICCVLCKHSCKVFVVRVIIFFLQNQAAVLSKLKDFSKFIPATFINEETTVSDNSDEENHDDNASIHNTEAAAQPSTNEAAVQQSDDEVAVEPSEGNAEAEVIQICDYKKYAAHMLGLLRIDDTDTDEVD